jgi:hypothetical protein
VNARIDRARLLPARITGAVRGQRRGQFSEWARVPDRGSQRQRQKPKAERWKRPHHLAFEKRSNLCMVLRDSKGKRLKRTDRGRSDHELKLLSKL